MLLLSSWQPGNKSAASSYREESWWEKSLNVENYCQWIQWQNSKDSFSCAPRVLTQALIKQAVMNTGPVFEAECGSFLNFHLSFSVFLFFLPFFSILILCYWDNHNLSSTRYCWSILKGDKFTSEYLSRHCSEQENIDTMHAFLFSL